MNLAQAIALYSAAAGGHSLGSSDTGDRWVVVDRQNRIVNHFGTQQAAEDAADGLPYGRAVKLPKMTSKEVRDEVRRRSIQTPDAYKDALPEFGLERTNLKQ